jgi:hypothetical protein
VSSNLIAPTIKKLGPAPSFLIDAPLAHYPARMNRLFICVCASLLLTACGGGGNAADAVNKEAAYLPDFSTPEGATKAFIYAYETQNAGLMSMTLLDDERETVLPRFEAAFSEIRSQGITIDLEQDEKLSEWSPDVEARALLKRIELKDGKQQAVTGGWYVFVKTPDDTWKFSDAATRRWIDYWRKTREAANKAPANEPPVD